MADMEKVEIPLDYGLKHYTSIDGYDCLSVTGPNGTYLVTPYASGPNSGFQVWRSDSLTTRSRRADRTQALEDACRFAGLSE